VSVGLQKFLATLNCIRNAWNRSNQERSIDKLQSDLNEMLFNAKCWTLIVQPSLKPKENKSKKNTDAALKESNASQVLVCGFRRILTRDANL